MRLFFATKQQQNLNRAVMVQMKRPRSSSESQGTSDEEWKRLYNVAKSGDMEVMATLLSSSALVLNETGERTLRSTPTALIGAAVRGELEPTTALLHAPGIDVNRKDS